MSRSEALHISLYILLTFWLPHTQSKQPVVLVSVLNPPSSVGAVASSTTKILDLTCQIPGLPLDSQQGQEAPAAQSLEWITQWIVESSRQLGRGVQVFIDAIDVLGEDYEGNGGGVYGIGKMVKMVVKTLSSLKGELISEMTSNPS